MRQRFFTAALFLTILLCPGALTAQFNFQDWAWRTTLTPRQDIDGMAALLLDGPVYDRLLTPPDDFRLVNQRGALVPHAIQCGRTSATRKVVARPVQIINRTYVPKRFSRAVLDFGERIAKNKLKIDLPGQNYRRRVTIEGGDDGTTWETVAENLFLFDIQVPGQSHRVDALAFAENRFRYLRLTVENMPDDPERVEIQGASAFYEEAAGEPQLMQVAIVKRNIEQDKKTHSTVITLDLGFRHLPLQTLVLTIDDPLFQRAYSVSGRNTTTHKTYRRAEEAWRAEEAETPWSSISHGTFYRRLDQGKVFQSIEAVIPDAAYRYLRVTVKNNDDAELTIRDITVERRTCAVLFKAQPGAQYTLYGGSNKAGAPSYDLARVVPGLDISILPQMTHGAIESLKPEEPRIPWSERYRYVISAGVIVAVMLMLWIIVPALRKETETTRKS